MNGVACGVQGHFCPKIGRIARTIDVPLSIAQPLSAQQLRMLPPAVNRVSKVGLCIQTCDLRAAMPGRMNISYVGPAGRSVHY